MKAFNYMPSGPQDAARINWIKQLHGDLSARRGLHTDRHHRLVCNTHTHPLNIHRDLTAKTGADESNFLISVMKVHEIPRGIQTPASIFLRLDSTSGSLKKHWAHMEGGSKVTKHTKTPFRRFNQSHWVWQSSVTFLYFNRRDVPEQTFHYCKGRNCGQNWTTERKSSPAWTWM